MRSQDKRTSPDEAEPDRLSVVILITSICIASLFGFYGLAIFAYAGWHLPPSLLPMTALGVIGMLYGWLKISRGSAATRGYASDRLIKMRKGAIAGSVGAFIVITIAQATSGEGFYWSAPYLFLAIPGALFFGVAPGGILGIFLSKAWKNDIAPYVGGVISGVLAAIGYILYAI